ncbi:MAG TPA: carbamoyltransferase HypF [Solirubrobacteraceae bacterium]
MTLAPVKTLVRRRIRVTGTVQGVGFRPYVYRLAGELGLSGFVLNDAHGVMIEAEGPSRAVDELLSRLKSEAPPLAAVEDVRSESRPPLGERGFEIRASPRGGIPDAPVTPDTATCEQCLQELFDPADRRWRYPFINCTNCGPRFTIVTGVPYDRPLTTMRAFRMCARCQAEYDDPADRRFHAQPNACPKCGPLVRAVDRTGKAVSVSGDPIEAVAAALRAGEIVAIKGIGGFHLACRADDETAVARLRARKHREHKPFALMVGSLSDAQPLVELGDAERELLCSPARPIVLMPRRPDAPVAGAVAPGFAELGVMLPYSPLHHLLLRDVAPAPLVMTSGNVSDEPIAYHDDDALARLAPIADLFLLHDRPIHTRTDDSVARVVAAPERQTALLRRSRGYVPGSLRLPAPAARRPLLACGAQLKNTFCLAKGERAWVGHHIGDLQNYETLRSFTEGIEHFERLFAVRPQVVVHDLHPEYLSTKYALEREGVELLGVQHHHAHLAACLAEHGESGPAVGAIFDGTGYGTDGTAWGGELLYGDAAGFARVGSLEPVRLPGGERAIREPWRMACSWLSETEGGEPALPPGLEQRVDHRSWRLVAGMAARAVNSPITSSVGRLFDTVAALCGICLHADYEGQAAIELEARCDPGDGRSYAIALAEGGGYLTLDPRPALAAIVGDLRAGVAVGQIASGFHTALADASAEACRRAAGANDCELVVLSGGVFQNRRLLEATASRIDRAGLRVLVPELLPANDGGISYGQAAIAARRLAEVA